MKKFLLVIPVAAALVAPAQAADIPVKAAPPAVAAVYNWTGFYLGVQTGVAIGTSVQSFNGLGISGSTDRYDIRGLSGGGTAGFNYQFNNFVIGIESDISVADFDGRGNSSASYGCGAICATEVKWFGTVRGRAGVAFNNWFLYGTGGWAYANIRGFTGFLADDHNRTGWTAGGGVEYGFTPNWSFKLEYLHFHFNSFVWTNSALGGTNCTGLNCATDAKFGVIRGGVNFRWGGSPVVARY